MSASKKKRKRSFAFEDSPFPCLHISGLDARDRAKCKVKMYDDKYVFKTRGQSLEVPKSEISHVSKEIERYMDVVVPEYSPVGGLIGAAAFGPLGLLMGMPTRQPKEVKRKRTLLVFERVGDEPIVLHCHQWVPEVVGRQYARMFVEDFEDGIGYAK